MTKRPRILDSPNLGSYHDLTRTTQDSIQVQFYVLFPDLLEFAEIACLLLGKWSPLSLNNQEVVCLEYLHEQVTHLIADNQGSEYQDGELALGGSRKEEVSKLIVLLMILIVPHLYIESAWKDHIWCTNFGHCK